MTREPPGDGLVLGEGNINLHAVECGGGFVWCGCATKPSRLLRLSPDLTECETMELHGCGSLHDLCWDETHLWAAHSSGHLSRVEPATAQVETYPLSFSGTSHPFAYSCSAHGDSIWMAMYTQPGSVLRFRKHDCVQTEYQIPHTQNWALRDLTFVAGRFYVVDYGVRGRVVAVDPETGEQETIPLGEGNVLPSCIATVGSFVWAGLDTMPARVVRLEPDTRQTETVTLSAASSSCRALAVTGQNLWIGLHTEPACVVRLDTESGQWETIELPTGYDNARAMASDGTDLFVGLQRRRHLPSSIYQLSLEGRGIRGRHRPAVSVTAQDWYRIRRGEDQLRWGKTARLEALPGVLLSRRAGEELAFLSPEQRDGVIARLTALVAAEDSELASLIESGSGRELGPVGELRIIFRRDLPRGGLEVSTIRQQPGVAFDPEVMGFPPAVPGLIHSGH